MNNARAAPPRVAMDRGQIQTLLAERSCGRVLAVKHGQLGGGHQAIDPSRHLGGTGGQGRVQPAPPLAQVSAEAPERTEHGGHAQAGVGIASRLDGPRQRQAEVGQLGGEPGQALGHGGAVEPRRHGLTEPQIEGGVTPPRLLRLAAGVELLPARTRGSSPTWRSAARLRPPRPGAGDSGRRARPHH